MKNENFTLDSCDSLVDYLYVEDFVFGINEIIDKNILGKIIISSGITYNIKNIVENIANLCNFQGIISFDKSKDRKGFQKYFCGDNSKLLKYTDWKEIHSLSEGLYKTIEGIKNAKQI